MSFMMGVYVTAAVAILCTLGIGPLNSLRRRL